ncbi:MAG: hypothetical protein IJU56_10040 [Clostridia bacterium]|nr:hypothetical protein [Clostridia bacterium]
MAVQVEKFSTVLSALSESLQKLGFAQSGELQIGEEDAAAVYTSDKGALQIKYKAERVEVYTAEDAETLESAGKRLVVSLLPADANDKDVRYVTGEINETIQNRFGTKAPLQKKQNQKMPQTVSKAAVKAGSFYDPNTLASKLCLVFPELREPYKANLAAYGEFLAEEFFENYGTPRVIAAINENRPATMKKLFQTLNEIYEDGTNDTQSLIAVTILGALNNDQILLARCVDYMSETMAPPVIEVNRFLATSAGKKAKKKMQSPPPYKPKKKKKQGFLSQMMAGGGGMAPPAI